MSWYIFFQILINVLPPNKFPERKICEIQLKSKPIRKKKVKIRKFRKISDKFRGKFREKQDKLAKCYLSWTWLTSSNGIYTKLLNVLSLIRLSWLKFFRKKIIFPGHLFGRQEYLVILCENQLLAFFLLLLVYVDHSFVP